jgi:hypothetical protein
MAELQVFPVTLRDGSIIGVEAEKQPTRNEVLKIEEAILGELQPKRSIEEAVATGAATGLAPSAAFLKTFGATGRLTAGAPLPVRLAAPLVAGAGAAAATGLAQSELLQRYFPDTASSIQEMAQTRPISTLIGSAITSGFRPGGISPKGIGQDLLERLPAAALGGGIQAGAEAFQMEAGELPAGAGARIAESALLNAVLNRETAYGRALIGPAAVRPSQLPKPRPTTPITDNLGQIKAGEPLPSATAKANQMATGATEVAPSPTQELKQQKTKIEAQIRQEEQLVEEAQKQNVGGINLDKLFAWRSSGARTPAKPVPFTPKEEQIISNILGGFGSDISRGIVPGRSTEIIPMGEGSFTAETTPFAAAESARAFTEQPYGVIPSAAEATTAFLEGSGRPVVSRQQIGIAEDLIGELQYLTNRSRQSIIKDADAANITELSDLITWLKGEVGYARNPLSNPERRISELTIKVRESEAEANRKLNEILGIEPEEPTVRREARTADEIGGSPRTREGAAEIPILAGPERQQLPVQRGAISPRLLQLERPIYDSGFKDQLGNIIWVDEFGRSVNAPPFEGPRETTRPETPAPAAEVQAPASAQARPVTPEGPLARVLEAPSRPTVAEAPAPVPAPQRGAISPRLLQWDRPIPRVKLAPAPTPEAPRAVKPTETAKDEATRLGLELASLSRRLADAKSGKLGRVTKKEIAQLEKTTDQVRKEFLAKSDEAQALEQAPEAPAPTPVAKKESIFITGSPEEAKQNTKLGEEFWSKKLGIPIDDKARPVVDELNSYGYHTEQSGGYSGYIVLKTKYGTKIPKDLIQRLKDVGFIAEPEGEYGRYIILIKNENGKINSRKEWMDRDRKNPVIGLEPNDAKKILFAIDPERFASFEKFVTPSKTPETKPSLPEIKPVAREPLAEVSRQVAPTPEPAPEIPAPKMSKEDADLNARIDKTIEELDLARANLEPLSKIIRILTKSKLLSEGDISQIRGAGKSMGPEDAATEAASILEFKRPEPPKAGVEVPARPEVTTPAPAAPAPAAEVPAQVKPKPTKEQRVAAIKERLAAITNKKSSRSEIDENVSTSAAEAVAAEPVPTETIGPKTQRRTVSIKETKTGWENETTGETYGSASEALSSIQKSDRESASKAKGTPIVTLINWQPTTRSGTAAVRTISGAKVPISVEQNKISEVTGRVFDKPYSFYKKEEGIGVPWFAEINGVEYPLKAMSLGNAKTEAKKLASEKLRPTGGPETLGILPRRMPSVGEPLAGAAIGYAT